MIQKNSLAGITLTVFGYELFKTEHVGFYSQLGTYMNRWLFFAGRFRIHQFLRGDQDLELHNHPWDFWTFPLVTYREEVRVAWSQRSEINEVRRFRWHFRPASYTHRVLDPIGGRPIWTIVIRGDKGQAWGFFRGQRFIPWREFFALPVPTMSV